MNGKLLSALLAVCAVPLLAGVGLAAWNGPPGVMVGQVTSVDGATTFDMVTEEGLDVTVRLWGIDQYTEPDERMLAGDSTAEFLFKGRTVICRRMQPLPSFGRVVAQCWVFDAAEYLVATGLARDSPEYSGGYYSPPDQD